MTSKTVNSLSKTIHTILLLVIVISIALTIVYCDRSIVILEPNKDIVYLGDFTGVHITSNNFDINDKNIIWMGTLVNNSDNTLWMISLEFQLIDYETGYIATISKKDGVSKGDYHLSQVVPGESFEFKVISKKPMPGTYYVSTFISGYIK